MPVPVLVVIHLEIKGSAGCDYKSLLQDVCESFYKSVPPPRPVLPYIAAASLTRTRTPLSCLRGLHGILLS